MSESALPTMDSRRTLADMRFVSSLAQVAWLAVASAMLVVGMVGVTIDVSGTPAEAAVVAAHHLGIPAASAASFEGLAIERAGGFPDAAELFAIASVSKPFTAVAVLTLVESGGLALDDQLAELVPRARLAEAQNRVGAVTVGQLLSHASGFTTTHGLVHGSEAVRASDFGLLAGLDLHAPPGASYAYSNLNYRVLGLIVEEITGRSFDRYMQDTVLAPLGLDETVATPLAAGSERLVVGHTQIAGVPIAVDWLGSEWETASGSVLSTRDDLVRFLQALIDPATSELLSQAAVSQMWSPQVDVSQSESWGLGWQVETVGGQMLVSHGGDLPGYQATIMAAPSRDAGFVFLANANSIPLAFAGEFALESIRRWVATGEAPKTMRLPRVQALVVGLLLLIAFLIMRDVVGVVHARARVQAIRAKEKAGVRLALSLLPALVLPMLVIYMGAIGVLDDALVMFPDAVTLAVIGAVVATVKIARTVWLFARVG